jgi:double-strand break repair protein MRE11
MGKVNNMDNIEVDPWLFQKGNTKIALYGIGYMKDERLNLAFEHKHIKFRRPEGTWFNILVLHQTKERGTAVGFNKRAFIKERTLPGFFDLVLWGHEHECVPIAKKCEQTGSLILYMGSTTVTSLIESEAKRKHCFILTVTLTQSHIEAVPLTTARPFIYDQIELHKCAMTKKDDAAILACIQAHVKRMIEAADMPEKQTSKAVGNKKLPLLRLKVEYTGYSVVDTRELGKTLGSLVANPTKDCIKFYRKPVSRQATKAGPNGTRNSESILPADFWREVEDPGKLQLDSIVGA